MVRRQLTTLLGNAVTASARGEDDRARVDQMLAFCWKRLIPISLAWVVVWACVQRLAPLVIAAVVH